MITVWNKHHALLRGHPIYIGRGSPLGNPYSHMTGTKAQFQVPTREAAIEAYEVWLQLQINADNALVIQALTEIGDRSMRGEDVHLMCFCKPKACHGDVIKRVVEAAIAKVQS